MNGLGSSEWRAEQWNESGSGAATAFAFRGHCETAFWLANSLFGLAEWTTKCHPGAEQLNGTGTDDRAAECYQATVAADLERTQVDARAATI